MRKIVIAPYQHTIKSGAKRDGNVRVTYSSDSDHVIIDHKKWSGGGERVWVPKAALLTVMKDFVQDMDGLKKPKRLHIGCRCRVKTDARRWKEYAGREIILCESSGTSFSAQLLPVGMTKLEVTEDSIGSGFAWIDADDLEFVDASVERNLAFHALCEEAETYACPDCGWYDPEYKGDENNSDMTCKRCGCEY